MLNITNNSVKSKLIQSELAALGILHSPKTVQTAFRWIIFIFCILFICMFLPWQQNIDGKGYISTLNPENRPQNIQSAIAGQIGAWRVQEGDFVHKNDTLIVISEVKDDYFDPNVLGRTNEQLGAKQQGLGAYQSKVSAIENQIEILTKAMNFSLQKAKNKLYQASLKVKSDSADLVAVQKNYRISQDRLNRGEALLKDGAISLLELESRRLKWQEDQAKTVAQEQKLAIAKNELTNARIELNAVVADYGKDIAKAQSERSSAVSNVADGTSEISKLKNKLANITVRQSLYVIRAPQDGYIVKTLKAGIGENIKEGESLIVFQPKTNDLAVELYVKPMDLPLLKIGSHTRLEFDGWPALQFSGWPGASVGTFGGRIAVIDQVISKNGTYRVLIVSDSEGRENEAWPKELRIGSGAKGFVMLKDVPIWWEIWRQLNGFPPDYLEDFNADDNKPQKK